MEPTANSSPADRRSTRIRAQIPFRLTSQDLQTKFSEQCHTLVVNTQGCGVRVSRALEAGLAVRLEDLPTGQVVTAIVVNCVALGSEGKFWLVGLALDQPGNIWGLNPAPADWGAPVVAVAAAAAVDATKKNEWPFSQFSQRGEFHPGRK